MLSLNQADLKTSADYTDDDFSKQAFSQPNFSYLTEIVGNETVRIMLARLLLILILVAGIAFGGYFGYNTYYFAPERILARSTEQFNKLQTVHADMDIDMNIHSTATGSAQPSEAKIKGFSDLNLIDKTQKTHMDIGSGQANLSVDVMLLKGGDMYMKMPLLGDNWIELNLQTLRDQGQLPYDPQSNDYVSQSLGFLKSVDQKSIVKLEDEVLDGVKTSHIRLDISTEQYLAYLKQLPNPDSLINSFKDSSIKTELWIDKKTNYLVKMTSDIKNMGIYDKTNQKSLGSADMTMVINYSKYNESVDISKPSGTIIQYEELLKRIQQTAPAK